MTTFTDRETATILAALRYWQHAEMAGVISEEFYDIAAGGAYDGAGLTDDGIDDLCERLNLGPEACAVLDAALEPRLAPPGPLEPPLDEIVEAEQLAVAGAADTIAGKPVDQFYVMPSKASRPEMKPAPDPWHIGAHPGDEDGCTVRDQNGLIVFKASSPESAAEAVDDNNRMAA
jgi:hypothetical protein